MAKKVGLPDFVKSRHDNHFVEEISSRTRTSIIRKIPVDKIIPNLMQPRKDFGNIDELASSIGEKGILEPRIEIDKAIILFVENVVNNVGFLLGGVFIGGFYRIKYHRPLV